MNEAAALPSPRVVLSRRLQAVLRPPPTPTRLAPTSRLIAGYRTRRSGASPQNRRAGEGLPSSRRHHANVPRPLRRRVHRGCDSRLFAPSVAFAVKHSARLSLFRPKTVALTARQASLEATDRSLAPPKGAFDAGLRPDPFPDRAASLLSTWVHGDGAGRLGAIGRRLARHRDPGHDGARRRSAAAGRLRPGDARRRAQLRDHAAAGAARAALDRGRPDAARGSRLARRRAAGARQGAPL